ncbi:aldehyde dehydrogenase [Xanthobacter autotrophicus DSM 597]|uniref:aldehyde dehydrogenase n=1 Tax=Xanthobacter TaxID=279 RepID=UPI001AEAB5FF|nr:aldehyde dehydrogenase [Xanthobacter flavus]MBP2148021.1 acyl-CoA reductase-like NAD-dependent aldehyde dehydrogenase [Xanthobacter flavus]
MNAKAEIAIAARGNFIDGREVESIGGGTVEVKNPATGAVIATIPDSTREDVDAAVKSARAAFNGDAWGGMAIRERVKLINRIADAFEAALPELYQLETQNNGRPVNETRAQLGRLPDFLRYFGGLALARRDDVIPVEGNYLNYTRRTPIGVVANCTPFNHPLMILCKSLAAVLASGCTTVVKPSEYTPLTTLRLAKLMSDNGLPPGVFNVVNGIGGNSGRFLAEHHDINKLVLTGGTEAGRIAGSAAAKVFAHQTLELGGKTPVMVFDDYDVEQAVNYAAFGAFVGAGQTCVCAARHIVQKTIYDEFVERLAAKTKAIRIGDPRDPETQLGPVVSQRQLDRVLSFVQAGHDDGARLVAGGQRRIVPGHENGFFVEPTVFADVAPHMRIAREEVFGPFTVVIPFETEEEALAIANDSPFGLAAAIRTRDVHRAHRVAAKVKAGIVWINDHHRLDPASPWGGVDDSGIGREFGIESFNDHFDVKSVMLSTEGKAFDWYKGTSQQPRLN